MTRSELKALKPGDILVHSRYTLRFKSKRLKPRFKLTFTLGPDFKEELTIGPNPLWMFRKL